ncbi:MAG: TolC family protein [Vicinamibacteraceae bacterium]
MSTGRRFSHAAGLVLAALVSLPARGASATQAVAPPPPPPALTTPLQPARPSAVPVVGAIDLTLDEAVALAFEHNLEIAVERLNPQTFDLQIAGVRALYRPVLSSTVGQNNVTQIPTNQLVGTQAVQNDQTTVNVGGSQLLPFGGGNLTVLFNNRRQLSTSSFNTFNPQFNSTFSALFVQPLLRNFRTDATRTQLRITGINRDISELQLRATITNTLADVRNAYWDYVYTVDQLQVARRSLELARKLLEDNRIRVEVGTLAPIDVVQAEAEVATRLQEEAQGEAQARTAELALKRLIVAGADDPRWRARIQPVDRPVFAPVPIDLDAALRRALDARLDLAQSRKQLQANDLSLKLLGNQRLPAADVSASYGLQGIGGARLVRDSNLGGQVVDTIPGSYSDALHLLRDREFPQWNLALTVSYPIGASLADANYARAQIVVRQTQAQIRALELQVATDVTNAALLIESNQKRVDAARAARQLVQRRLEAETSKFEVGLSTNFFVVQAQRDLAGAENIELRTRLDYQKSVVSFDRVQETSLGSAGISVVTTNTGARTP